MRAADEKHERGKTGSGKSKGSGKKWGDYTHFSPTAEDKKAIKERAAHAPTELLLWIDKRMQDGFSLSLKWVEDRDAIRAEMRAPGEDRMLAPAIASYHSDALVALHALWYADTIGAPHWSEERMSAKEAHNW